MLFFGKNPVWEALRAGRPLEKIFLDEGKRGDQFFQQVRALAKQGNVQVFLVSGSFFDQRFRGQVHQGVAAVSHSLYTGTLKELVEKKSANPLALALDHLQDPQNFGSLLRSAAAFGAGDIIYPGRRAVRITATVEKIAAGALSYTKLIEVTSLANALLLLQKEDFAVVGLEASSQENIWDVDLTGPTILVIGGEDKGLARMVKERCTHLAKIPLAGQIGSLNVGVAGAIVLAEAGRQRKSQL